MAQGLAWPGIPLLTYLQNLRRVGQLLQTFFGSVGDGRRFWAAVRSGPPSSPPEIRGEIAAAFVSKNFETRRQALSLTEIEVRPFP
jgi:hypothetical protein